MLLKCEINMQHAITEDLFLKPLIVTIRVKPNRSVLEPSTGTHTIIIIWDLHCTAIIQVVVKILSGQSYLIICTKLTNTTKYKVTISPLPLRQAVTIIYFMLFIILKAILAAKEFYTARRLNQHIAFYVHGTK